MMSLFGDIANAIGHTVESLAATIGADVSMLENVVNDLDGNGVDLLSAASRLGLSAEGLLSGIIDLMREDPHQVLLQRLTGPFKAMVDPLSQLSQYWMQAANLHQSTAQTIDTHFNELFQGSGSSSYSGPAADTLLKAHQDAQTYFAALVEHAQTQQTRHTTLGGHIDDYLGQMPGNVNRLSTPVAALAVLCIDTAAGAAPPGLQEFISTLEQWEEESPPPINKVIEIIVIGLVIIAFLWDFIVAAVQWIGDRIKDLTAPPKPLPRGLPPPQPPPGVGPPFIGPQNVLTTTQENLADKLYNDYKGLGLSLDDIRAIIEQNPNLTEGQLRDLLNRYAEVIKNNPNLVKKYGALTVFQQFIALSAYDPAHGGNYTSRKPSVPRDLYKGMDEAMVELGAMEMGLIDGPMVPSTSTDYEATDSHGQNWDVKSPRSTNPAGKPIFDAAKEAGKMKKDFDNKEKIIIDDTNITPEQRKELYEQLKANGNDGKVIWWPFAP